MTRRNGWAPPRKRKKRIAKKMSKNQSMQTGWRPKYVAVLSDEMSEEFVRQLIRALECRKSIS